MPHAKIWFVLSEGRTTGPFDHEEVESLLPTSKDPQVWGRGYSEWMTPTKWRQQLKDSGQAHASAADTAANGPWKIREDGVEKKAIPYAQLVAYLKSLKDFSGVDVAPPGSDHWKDVYSVPRLVEELGISRRSHPRVPILGTLAYEVDGRFLNCRVISISEGGLGVTDLKGVSIGERIEGTLSSPSLFVTIPCRCEIVYVGHHSYAGLRFVHLPMEFKSSIIEYVNKFAV